MSPVTARRTVRAPAETVWALATDIAGWPGILSGVSRVELLTSGVGFTPGTRWRETRTVMGREATEEMWVTAVDPGRSYTIEADGRGAHYAATYAFTAADAYRTEVVTTFDARPHGGVARALATVTRPLSARVVGRALAQDLADLAAAAERRAGDGADRAP